MALNGISTETSTTPDLTKLLRRTDKLALAATKRQAVGTPGARTGNVIVGTHSAYVNGNLTAGISGTVSPTPNHPWS